MANSDTRTVINDYWYTSTQIEDIGRAWERGGFGRVFATLNDHAALKNDEPFRTGFDKATLSKIRTFPTKILLPLNKGSNHWTSVAIHIDEDEREQIKVRIVFTDSLSTVEKIDKLPKPIQTELLRIEKLFRAHYTTEELILSKEVYAHSWAQPDGSSCGAYALANGMRVLAKEDLEPNPGRLALRKKQLDMMTSVTGIRGCSTNTKIDTILNAWINARLSAKLPTRITKSDEVLEIMHFYAELTHTDFDTVARVFHEEYSSNADKEIGVFTRYMPVNIRVMELVRQKVAVEKLAAALKAASVKVAADKAAADKAAADKAAADKAAADKAAADKAAADKAAADKAAADKAAPDKTAADNAAADKTAVDNAAADKTAVDNAAADKTAVDKAAADKTAVDKAAVDKTAADKAAADKAAADKAAADKVAADEANRSIRNINKVNITEQIEEIRLIFSTCLGEQDSYGIIASLVTHIHMRDLVGCEAILNMHLNQAGLEEELKQASSLVGNIIGARNYLKDNQLKFIRLASCYQAIYEQSRRLNTIDDLVTPREVLKAQIVLLQGAIARNSASFLGQVLFIIKDFFQAIGHWLTGGSYVPEIHRINKLREKFFDTKDTALRAQQYYQELWALNTLIEAQDSLEKELKPAEEQQINGPTIQAGK